MRIDLASSIPLPAPFVLFVEPTNVCNFKCPICPESFPNYEQQAGYYQKMKAETWRNVLKSLRGWCKLKTIRFYHTGEPLLNGDLGNMIREAHAVSERTEVTTNASRLNRTWAVALIAAELDYLRISVYGTTAEAYQRETGNPGCTPLSTLFNVSELRKERDARRALKPHIHAELVTSEPGQEDAFLTQWRDVADSTGVKALHNWGDSLVSVGSKSTKLVCPFPFYELAVKSNGDVSVCCVDWSNQLVVGNVNRESLREIWEGPRLKELRDTHLAGRRDKLVACRDCNVLDTCPDDLDRLVLQTKTS
jgi:radical SAM protein with 4Fe4S-binding SPASM domain